MTTTATRDQFVERVLHGGDRSAGAGLLRAALTPLAWLHRIGLEAYLLPYATGVRRRYRLRTADGAPVPVIAIGNLSSGGTGKTPMAHRVAERLRAQGRRVVLLSRGHGGSGESGRLPRIVSDGERALLSPDAAGDEPALLASLLPDVPVIVGRDRRLSGRLAVERFAPDVIVLDDALQYWQLHRDLDIVLLDACRPFDNGWVLPRGLLREPPSHLRRAGIVVLTRADRVAPAALQEGRALVRRCAPNAAVFSATHAPVGWVRAADETLAPLSDLTGKRVFTFSGIADSAAFVRSVAALGAVVTGERALGDHHAYTPADVRELSAAAADSMAVTTEKDLVKVAPLWPASGPPLYALRVAMRINDEPAFLAALDRAVAAAACSTPRQSAGAEPFRSEAGTL